MPTILIRHATKRYGDEIGAGDGPLDRMLGGSRSSIFGGQSTSYLDQIRRAPEYADRENALDDLSLTIKDGETLAILGPSGCGKTTLLKIIAGLMKPDSGEVRYDSALIQDIPMSERGIGMVFQNYALYPHMESRDNISFYDRIHKQPERIPERIHHIVNVMGVKIEHLLSRKPPTLSGGEQQRVAMARCLARDPQVFLFDEPISNLDAKLRVQTRVQIKRLLSHYKITSVYVTHDQQEAISMGDRLAIMRAGKIEQIGTYRTLYETPLNAFVAQFFGNPPMNLFAGHIWGDAWEGPGDMKIEPIRPGLRQGQPVLVGIRPEHIQIVNDGIPGRIELIEPNVNIQRQILHVTVAGQKCLVNADLGLLVERGDPIRLAFPTAHIYLFDNETGQRIG